MTRITPTEAEALVIVSGDVDSMETCLSATDTEAEAERLHEAYERGIKKLQEIARK